jgi:pectinesterase inhibitor-like protein
MGPSQALPGLVLLLLLVSSSASVLDDTCKSFGANHKDIGYDYCIKFFQADKGSATADKRGLAVIASKIIKATASSTGKRIAAVKASVKDKKVRSGLDDCHDVYSEAVDELDAAVKGVEAGTPQGLKDAVTNLSGAMDAPQTCETGFQELGLQSPLAAEDSEFTREVSVALVITSSL